MVKRLCLFAAYSGIGRVEDYAIYYVKAMSELADVYYMADCSMNKDELDKLQPYVKDAVGFRHGKYDFGSWQELINKLGYDKISEYDELILCNDSCFGPLCDLAPFFDAAGKDKDCDFWAFTYNYMQEPNTWHLQSYFLVFKKQVVHSKAFKEFMSTIKAEASALDVIVKYESALTPILEDAGFQGGFFIPLAKDIYTNWKDYLKNGLPLFKVKVPTVSLFARSTDCMYGWDRLVTKLFPDYPINLIHEYIKVRNIDTSLMAFLTSRKFISGRLKSARLFVLWVKCWKGKRLLRIFGKDFINKDPSLPVKPALKVKKISLLGRR